MYIFLSYAGEHREVADRLTVGLQQEGHDVFFDRDDLPPGEGYDREIRRQIRKADLFLFLVSPESLDATSYAMTELDIARRRWPNPSGRVLPVMVAETSWESVPAYLASVTVLEPRGNVTADVLARVEELARRRKRQKRRLLMRTAGSILVLAAALGGIVLWIDSRKPPEPAEPCVLQVTAVGADGSTPLARGNLMVYAGADETPGTLLPGGSGEISIASSQLERWTIEVVDSGGTILGKETVHGCPEDRLGIPLSDSAGLVLEPR